MKLTISKTTFFKQLSSLIESGVMFDAVEEDDNIIITFTGGY